EVEGVGGKFRGEPPPETHAFVRASGRRARWRQTISGLTAVAFAILASLATYNSFEAKKAQTAAQAAEISALENYKTARGTVDSLIAVIAGGLRDLQGVTVQTVDTALSRIREIVARLGDNAARNDPTFNGTRAAMLYEFSKNYQRSVPGQAMSLAEQSLQLRQELAARFPDDRELAWDLSLSYELVGDLARATS